MTERRPHWDDELIDTVRSHFYENGFVEEVFGVIAAVEDWQATQFVELPAQPYECDAAEAAIQRVREALHAAFAIIANAQNCLGDGDPVLGPQWHEAAQRFMQDYNANLDVYTGYRVRDDA